MKAILSILVTATAAFAQTTPPASATTTPPAMSTSTTSLDDTAKTRADLERAQKQLSDWPNLGRYHNDNAKVSSTGSVVFMGDSITDAWGRTYGKFFQGKNYINRGISGQTTPQMLIRFRPDVVAFHPSTVVILAGTNDIAGNTGPMTIEAIEDNLMSMADLAKANNIKVVMASVLPICDSIKPQSARRPPDKIKALNDWMKSYAAKNNMGYLDYYSAMVGTDGMLKKELTYDCLHPNNAGYEVMEPLAAQAIAKAAS